MIVGTLALIGFLLGGNVMSVFLVDELEKGVKEYVVDKERKDEILNDLKTSKAFIEAYNKEKKEDIKLLKRINADRSSDRSEFNSISSNLTNNLIPFQERVINDRIMITAKITQEEWDQIIAKSDEAVIKEVEKQSKKNIKDSFASLDLVIDKTIKDKNNLQVLHDTLDYMKNSYYQLTEQIASINSVESDVLNSRTASKEELTKVANEIYLLRKEAFESFVNFHFTLKENSDEEEWAPIIKEVNNLLE